MATQRGTTGESDPEQALVSALQSLHRHAGKPSARSIATAVGNVSHTTVAEALSGRRIPSWPILSSLVRQLAEGDEELVGEYHDLWSAATDQMVAAAHDERDFPARYRRQVMAYYGQLPIPDFDRRRGVPVDELYVPPTIIPTGRHHDLTLDTLSIFSETGHAVLLGGPGSGKSTFARYLMFHTARSGAKSLPFLVPIQEFAGGSGPAYSVVGFIEQQLETVLQSGAPKDAVSQLMDDGNALVIFDGLDEILDTSQRRQTASTIEAFSAEFPRVWVMVTSRPAGYMQAMLDPQLFVTYQLEDFNDAQVDQYVAQWFAHIIRNRADANGLRQSFLRETAHITDLRANPLMLAMLCALYQGRGAIVRSLPELFERFIDLALNQWDRSRWTATTERAQYFAKSILRHLAFWLLDDRGGRPVTHQELVAVATSYLVDRLERSDEADHLAEELLTFFDSIGMLGKAGTTPSGEPLYGFTSLSLLEYFAAAHLVATTSGPDQLARVLAVRLVQGQPWFIVGQNAVQIADRQIELGAERVIQALLKESGRVTEESRQNLRSFLVSCLDLVYLSPPLTRTLAEFASELSTAGQATDRKLQADLMAEPDAAGYRGAVACQLAGITYRMLDYWTRTGLVTPSLRSSGGRSLYSYQDVLILRVIKRLLDSGVSLQNIRTAVHHLRRRSLRDVANVTLFSDGTTIYEATSPEEVNDLLQGGQGVFGISLSAAINELNAAIDEFPPERAAADDDELDNPSDSFRQSARGTAS